MNFAYNLGIIIIAVILAFFAGMFSNLEYDSRSENVNNLIIDAPRKSQRHKLFFKTTTSNSILLVTIVTIAGILFQTLQTQTDTMLALVLSALIASVVYTIITLVAYMAQITTQALYDQPLYVDVLVENTMKLVVSSFICSFAITLISYIIFETMAFNLSVFILNFILAVAIGSISTIVENKLVVKVCGNGSDIILSEDSFNLGILQLKVQGLIKGILFSLLVLLFSVLYGLLSTSNALVVVIIVVVLLVIGGALL